MAKKKKRKSVSSRKKIFKRRKTIAPHRKVRRYCRACTAWHSKMTHRSHGHGSFARAHKRRGKKRR